MKKFLFLSSFVVLGLFFSNCMAQTPPASSRAVDTSGPSSEQLANEIAKKNADSDKYLLNEAGKTEPDKKQPQIVTDMTITPEGQATTQTPPAAMPAMPNANGQTNAPVRAQPPAPTSSINSGTDNESEGFTTSKTPAQGQSSGSDSTNSNKDSGNWNLGY